MRKYSVFAIAREAMRGHKGWEQQWTSPEPKKAYDVIIVGAGGHGLATAYYLAKEHGITNVAVHREGLARRRQHRPQHHHHPLQLPLRRERRHLRPRREAVGGLSQDLNYNVMYSPARRHDAGAQRARRAGA
jgi:sarcosine oxidase subunit beta